MYRRKRKVEAAPGLDGWRTQELQCLPPLCFKAFADIFNLLEQTELEPPATLVVAKQVLLNKNGNSSPLQKRLITLMPCVLVAYTGRRFAQLAEWQATTMPRAIQGAISGRNMSAVHHQLRVDIDQSRIQGEPLVGIKLDKSKCFDRLIPQQIAALFLAFGLPQGLTRAFLKIYRNLRRHLGYKSWVSPIATTAANGVTQGCSLSLIAVNLFTKVWALMLDCLPGLVYRAFIDDAHIWTHLCNIHVLQSALQITSLWDNLMGQKLNSSKSTIWGTTSCARKAVKSAFPDMQLCLEFDVLGVKIYTFDRDSFQFTDSKLEKILLDTRNIFALPLPVRLKCLLISAKVIPQCTYGAAITKMPKLAVKKIQNEVTNVLWGRRPHWRAKWLVMGLLGQPHRTEPVLARAYATICDFLRVMHTHSDILATCKSLALSGHRTKHSLIDQVCSAFKVFGFGLSRSFNLHFRNCSHGIPLELLHPKDIRKVLIHLARDVCYKLAGESKKRKDFFKPKGILDFDLSSLFRKKSSLQVEAQYNATTFFDSQQVGCSLTRDRLKAAGLIDHDHCRFCEQQRETLSHLVSECPVLRQKLGILPEHELGLNFSKLGIVDHPYEIAMLRLRCFTTFPCASAFAADQEVAEYWTDGSLLWPDVFWLTSAAFSVVDCGGNVMDTGPVFHFSLSSYAAEMWGIIVALAHASGPCVVYTDSETIVKLFAQIQVGGIPLNVSHRSWWVWIMGLWRERRASHPDPFRLVWIPSHLLPHISTAALTDELAGKAGSTKQHIAMNRIADHIAQKTALEMCVVPWANQSHLMQQILQRQEWLTQMNYMLGEERVNKPCDDDQSGEEETLIDQLSDAQLQTMFSKWLWHLPFAKFGWKPKIPSLCERLPRQTNHVDSASWDHFLTFVRGTCWSTDAGHCMSYVELAFIMILRCGPPPCLAGSEITFDLVIRWIKKMFLLTSKDERLQCHPGTSNPAYTKPLGRCVTPGALQHTELWITQNERLKMARFMLKYGGRDYGQWAFPVAEL